MLAALALVYVVTVCVIVALRAESSSDFRDFWENAVHFRQTGQISRELGVHNYLPVFTILMTPWGLLPLRVAIVLFTLVSLAAFAAAVLLSARVLAASRDPADPADPAAPQPDPALVALAAIGLSLAYLTSCLVVGQLAALLLMLCIAALALVRDRRSPARGSREWLAGAALALATLIKLLPAALVVFFLLRGRWRVGVSAAATGLVLGLGLPLAALGWDETVAAHEAFRVEALQGHSAYTTIHADKPIKANFSNNAAPITLRRLMSPVVASKGRGEGIEWRVNVLDAPPGVIWATYLAVLGVLVAGSLWVAWRARDECGAFAAWTCLMLLASPLVWTHYLVLAYFALAWLAHRGIALRAARGRPSRAVLVGLVAWALGVALLSLEPARAAGGQIVPVAVVWGACVLLAGRDGAATRSHAGG